MRRALAVGVAAAVAAGLGACGGGDDEDVERVLDQAFSRSIGSAVVTADLEVEIEGIEQLGDPLRLKLTGPYRSGGDDKLPAFDWDVSFSGGGQTISGGLISTGDNVFVDFQGTAFELGEKRIAGFNSQLRRDSRAQGDSSLAEFGIDPANWIGEGEDEGGSKVAGVETTHVRARIDVERMLDDLNALIDRAGPAVAGVTPPPKLTEEQQESVADVIGEPELDVYVGKADSIVRRVSADLELEVPEDARDAVGGIEGGRISISVEFADVGRPQRIEAPRDARPIEELASQLGGLQGLGGGGERGGGSGSGGQPFERYSQCLDRADPSQIEEIEACSELLR